MDVFEQAVEKIIKEQEVIIGPVALQQAQKVTGLVIDQEKHVHLQGNKTQILEDLIKSYEELFGRASVETCKEAVEEILPNLPPDEIPASLKES